MTGQTPQSAGEGRTRSEPPQPNDQPDHQPKQAVRKRTLWQRLFGPASTDERENQRAEPHPTRPDEREN
ncbi:MAG: hypothetical protein WCS37_18870, partial [Chloroflexota bacterium]